MCTMLYIGSDNELPTIDYQEGKDLPLYIGELYRLDDVRRYFIKKYQYVVGPGCVCDIRFDKANEIDDISEMDERGRRRLSDIFDFIKENVIASNCELVSIVENYGDDGEQELKYKDAVININDFNWKDKFSFLEGQRIKVYK